MTSKGSPGRSAQLTEAQLALLEQELAKGPAAAGYDDQRWTLARVASLIWKLFRVRYSLKGASLVLQRMDLWGAAGETPAAYPAIWTGARPRKWLCRSPRRSWLIAMGPPGSACRR